MIINSELVQAFQLGIGLGILVLSTLILFPGRTEQNVLDAGVDAVANAEKENAEHGTTARTAVMKESSWSPHRRLNTAVYFVLLSSALVIWFTNYANIEGRGPVLPYIFKAYFPRESSAFNKPSSKQKL